MKFRLLFSYSGGYQLRCIISRGLPLSSLSSLCWRRRKFRLSSMSPRQIQLEQTPDTIDLLDSAYHYLKDDLQWSVSWRSPSHPRIFWNFHYRFSQAPVRIQRGVDNLMLTPSCSTAWSQAPARRESRSIQASKR